MNTIYKVVRKTDHSFIYAIFDSKEDANAYTQFKNLHNSIPTETITVQIDEDIYEDIFFPT